MDIPKSRVILVAILDVILDRRHVGEQNEPILPE